jgi:hypothetical protein
LLCSEPTEHLEQLGDVNASHAREVVVHARPESGINDFANQAVPMNRSLSVAAFGGVVSVW